MGDGFIQFLVIAFFVIITIMDGAARKKKREEAQRRGQIPEPDGPPGADDDERLVEGSSEGMVPEDLWEEIAALARGEHPAQRTEPPALPRAESPTAHRTESRTVTRTTQRSARMQEYDGQGGMQEYDGQGGMQEFDGEDGMQEYERPDTVREPAPPDFTWSPDGSPPVLVTETTSRPVGRPTFAPPTEVRQPPAQVRPPLSEAQHEHVLHREGGAATDPSEGASRTSRGATGRVASLRRAIVMAEVLKPPVAFRDERGEPFG